MNISSIYRCCKNNQEHSCSIPLTQALKNGQNQPPILEAVEVEITEESRVRSAVACSSSTSCPGHSPPVNVCIALHPSINACVVQARAHVIQRYALLCTVGKPAARPQENQSHLHHGGRLCEEGGGTSRSLHLQVLAELHILDILRKHTHTHVHTYIYIYIHTYIHTYRRTYI